MIVNSVVWQLGIIDWNLSNGFWRSGSLFHVTCECSITYNDLHKKANVLPQPIQEEGDIEYGLDGFVAGTLAADSHSLHRQYLCCRSQYNQPQFRTTKPEVVP